MNNLALALDGRGDREAAIGVWRDALRNTPGHRQSEANLAHALARAGRYREASVICAEHLRRFPDAEASMWAQQGICLYRLGDRAGSNSCFERSLALAPDDTSILVNIASTLSEARDFAGAEAIFSRVVSRNAPESVRVDDARALPTAPLHVDGTHRAARSDRERNRSARSGQCSRQSVRDTRHADARGDAAPNCAQMDPVASRAEAAAAERAVPETTPARGCALATCPPIFARIRSHPCWSKYGRDTTARVSRRSRIRSDRPNRHRCGSASKPHSTISATAPTSLPARPPSASGTTASTC